MLTVNKLVPRGRGLASVLLKRASQVALDWDQRSRSRLEATDSAGRRLGVFLPRGQVLRGGDVLVGEDGSLVRVQAALQPVMVVRACAEHGSPFDLLRAAYHLGNRHVQLELQPDRLQFEPDAVLADMLRQMHLIVTEEQAAFEPESGAYAATASAHAAHAHAHAHDHDHDHDQEHGHGHGHGHGPANGRPHELGHSHGHGHAHGLAHSHGHGRDHDPAHDDAQPHSHDDRARKPGHDRGHAHDGGRGHGHE